MKKMIMAILTALVVLVASAVALTGGFASANADPVGSYQVTKTFCSGDVATFHYGTDLASASQYEVDSVRYQEHHAGWAKQVRLTQVTSNNPEITTLISKNDDTC